MNSRIIKKDLKKALTNLSVCLVAALILASCSSTNSRDVAAAKEYDETHKTDVSKMHDADQAPHKLQSKRFENYNGY